MVSTPRPFVVTVIGATGHSGRHCVRYLHEHYGPSLPFAIAGRNRAKLDALRTELDLSDSTGVFLVPDLSLPDDAASSTRLAQIAAQTDVILTTSGPFSIFGEAVVKACIASNAHYVDITGEVAYARRMMDKYDAPAREARVKVVPFGGFDSVPSDVGAYLAVKRARERDPPIAPGTIVHTVRKMSGGLNGGTLRTAVLLSAESDPIGADRVALHPPEQRTDAQRGNAPSFSESLLPWRVMDNGTKKWSTPFFMSGVNSSVVRATGAALNYGPSIRYYERTVTKGFWGAFVGAAFLWVAGAVLSTSLGRALALRFGPKAGEGPSDDLVYKTGFFKSEMHLWPEGADVTKDSAPVRLGMTIATDPGNGLTSACACETAVCLARDQDKDGFPEKYGVLTPIQALGDPLARRVGKLLNLTDL